MSIEVSMLSVAWDIFFYIISELPQLYYYDISNIFQVSCFQISTGLFKISGDWKPVFFCPPLPFYGTLLSVDICRMQQLSNFSQFFSLSWKMSFLMSGWILLASLIKLTRFVDVKIPRCSSFVHGQRHSEVVFIILWCMHLLPINLPFMHANVSHMRILLCILR